MAKKKMQMRLMGRNAKSETRISNKQRQDTERNTGEEAVDVVEEEVDMDTTISLEEATTAETQGEMETT